MCDGDSCGSSGPSLCARVMVGVAAIACDLKSCEPAVYWMRDVEEPAIQCCDTNADYDY